MSTLRIDLACACASARDPGRGALREACSRHLERDLAARIGDVGGTAAAARVVAAASDQHVGTWPSHSGDSTFAMENVSTLTVRLPPGLGSMRSMPTPTLAVRPGP